MDSCDVQSVLVEVQKYNGNNQHLEGNVSLLRDTAVMRTIHSNNTKRLSFDNTSSKSRVSLYEHPYKERTQAKKGKRKTLSLIHI